MTNAKEENTAEEESRDHMCAEREAAILGRVVRKGLIKKVSPE